jgi:hypothetical protein
MLRVETMRLDYKASMFKGASEPYESYSQSLGLSTTRDIDVDKSPKGLDLRWCLQLPLCWKQSKLWRNDIIGGER